MTRESERTKRTDGSEGTASGTTSETTSETASGSSDVSWRQAMIVSGLALSLPAMLFGPPAIGYWLDSVLGTSPWFMLGFLAIGFLGTGIDVYVILKRTRVIA